MAFSDLCHIGNAYKSVENEPDQSERIMEENSMVRDLITKILDESGPTEGGSSLKPPEKAQLTGQNQYQKPDGFQPYNYQNMYNYPNPTQNEQPGFNYNLQNGFTNGFNYDTPLLGVDTVDSTDVSPEQLNLLRLAAQEIGGAQFSNPKFENYNFFDQPRNTDMFPNNFANNRTCLNMDMGFNSNFENPYQQRFPHNSNQENGELATYLNQLQVSDNVPNSNPNMEYKMADMKYPNEDFKMQDPKMYFNRNFQPPKSFNGDPNFFMNDMAQMVERPPPNYEYNQAPMNFKPNGFHPNEFMQRRDIPANHQRDFPPNGAINETRPFEANQNMQQAALMRQNQEIARQMNMLMRNRPPPNQLNVDVSFLHDNPNFNLGVGALLGPSPPVPPSVLPSPMLDLPLLAPFYTMRNMRGAATSSGILHARLDSCYEQWRQLERERKRTEARLALAFPGRAVSSSNSIPVPRLPPCPTRVDRLTVDMLREHTKVLTLMGKMETLRASVCVAQNKRPNKEDHKITVLKRGQENVSDKEKDGVDPSTFEPATWRADIGNLAEIAPHSEVESAMLAWRNAVGLVQLARRREMQNQPRYPTADPILQLAEAVKQLGICARRARCAMWCDLTLTVALAPPANGTAGTSGTNKTAVTEPTQSTHSLQSQASNKPAQEINTSKQDAKDNKEKDKAATEIQPDSKQENNNNSKTTNKNEKSDKRRPQNYRKVNGRNDFYQKNQRYDNRFMQNRPPYYLATGPIN